MPHAMRNPAFSPVAQGLYLRDHLAGFMIDIGGAVRPALDSCDKLTTMSGNATDERFVLRIMLSLA